MLQIGVQTKNVIDDNNPQKGFQLLKNCGFTCVDFSLNAYLNNLDLYQSKINSFFDQSLEELESFFTLHRDAANQVGISIHQMHMPYPIYVPMADHCINEYLCQNVATKSLYICHFLGCKYIVVHGFKLTQYVGLEQKEWEYTEKFIHLLAPIAKKLGITICLENIYDGFGVQIVEGPCCDAKKMVERIDRINAMYETEILGFCFDTGHANLTGLDFEGFLTTLGKRLKVLHIHDNNGREDLHQIPFTFTRTRGNLPSTDWEGFIKGLQNIQFDGVLNFETAPVLTAFPEEMKEDILRFIAKIGIYFAKQL